MAEHPRLVPRVDEPGKDADFVRGHLLMRRSDLFDAGFGAINGLESRSLDRQSRLCLPFCFYSLILADFKLPANLTVDPEPVAPCNVLSQIVERALSDSESLSLQLRKA